MRHLDDVHAAPCLLQPAKTTCLLQIARCEKQSIDILRQAAVCEACIVLMMRLMAVAE